MMYPRKRTAIKAAFQALLLTLLFCAAGAHAAPVGAVSQLSGTLFAQKADGAVKALALKSPVEQGDTLVTGTNAYAQIRFTDNSEITLKPDSQFKIDSFSFEPEKKEEDNALFTLIKGGLREVTGLLGKRSKERFGLRTPTATIGIRGTIFIAQYVPPEGASQGKMPSSPPANGVLPPGLYVQVLDGMIHLSNGGGQQNFSAGQFGYVPSLTQPPVVLPSNPGLQFTPPPSFTSSATEHGNGDSQAGKSGVDCEVR